MIEPAGKARPVVAPVRKTAQQPEAEPQPTDSLGHSRGPGMAAAPLVASVRQNDQNQGPGLPRPMTDEEKSDFKTWFPNLDVDQSMVTAEETPQYNCISWTTGNTESWDWPPHMYPELSDRDAFVQYYNDRGFQAISPEEAAQLDPAQNEVVLYWENEDGPTHGSVQGPTHGSRWESKCGQAARITHGRDELISEVYGEPKVYYKKVAEPPPQPQPLTVEVHQKVAAKIALRMAAIPEATRDKFQAAYSEWQAYRHSPQVLASSNPAAYCRGPGYEKLLHLGPPALPLFLEQMQKGDFFCQYAVEALSHKKDPFHVVGMPQPSPLKPLEVRCSEQHKADQLMAQWLHSSW